MDFLLGLGAAGVLVGWWRWRSDRRAAAAVDELAAAVADPVGSWGDGGAVRVWFCRCGSWGFLQPDGCKPDAGLMHERGRCYPLPEALS